MPIQTIGPLAFAAAVAVIVFIALSLRHSGAPHSGEPGIHNHENRSWQRSVPNAGIMDSGFLAFARPRNDGPTSPPPARPQLRRAARWLWAWRRPWPAWPRI